MGGNEKTFSREFTLADDETLTYIFVNSAQAGMPAQTKTDLAFRLHGRSNLTIWNLVFGSNESTLNQNVHFMGEGASSENFTVYFGEGSQNLQIFITYLHEAPGCTSRIFSRGILKDKAFGRYDGMIKILQTGKKTDTMLVEKTLLLSSGAKSEATPGLKIGTNDVRASHSASCERVDEAQLFYAASRGIPQEEALRIIAEGFLKNLLDKLPEKKLQKMSMEYIRKKLSLQIQ